MQIPLGDDIGFAQILHLDLVLVQLPRLQKERRTNAPPYCTWWPGVSFGVQQSEDVDFFLSRRIATLKENTREYVAFF